jgi:DNA-binding XRE family transcriptional regulator
MIEVKITNKIEEKIKELQVKTGCTKTWIAQQINVSKQTLQTIMKSQNPTIETLVKLSIILDCDMSELYETQIIQDGMIIEIYRDNGVVSLKDTIVK